jgi:hypothetical protein
LLARSHCAGIDYFLHDLSRRRRTPAFRCVQRRQFKIRA